MLSTKPFDLQQNRHWEVICAFPVWETAVIGSLCKHEFVRHGKWVGGEETKLSSWFWRQLCEFACRSQAYSLSESVWTEASRSISCIIVAVELVLLSTRGQLIVSVGLPKGRSLQSVGIRLSTRGGLIVSLLVCLRARSLQSVGIRLSTRGGLIVSLLVSLRAVSCNLSVCHIHLLFSPKLLLTL